MEAKIINICLIRPVDKYTIRYDEKRIQLQVIVGKETATNIINIIQEESSDRERRMAFLETTIEAALGGADYSRCKSINDIAKVYSRYLINKFFK